MTNEEAWKNINAYVIMERDNIPLQVVEALDVFRKANEKQIPKRLRECSFADGFCPFCDFPIIKDLYAVFSFEGNERITRLFCPKCGQAIDWSVEE